MIKLGEKIKTLRKQKNISQEVFANYLGVSFQAVSKWENGITMPDVTLIPIIASFFGVSTDELFDYNLYEIEKNIKLIVDEHSRYWDNDKKRAEQIIREGLKKYPANDILLNCLIGVLSELGKYDEIIEIGKALAKVTKHDDIRFDTYRIMAEAYKAKGEYQLAKETIENIPEIYFTKLEVSARLLDGEEMYKCAQKHKKICANDLIDMLIIIGKYLKKNGEKEKANSQFKIALNVINAFIDDFHEIKYFKTRIYDNVIEKQREIEQLLSE